MNPDQQTIPASIEHLDFKHTELCESKHCQKIGRGSHEADWFVTLSCGNALAWCNFRFMLYTREDVPLHDGIRCTHCGQSKITVTAWFPVRVQ